jgi:hypothetical protein
MILALCVSLVASDGLLLKGVRGGQALESDIAKARLQTPQAFNALGRLFAQLPQLDANRRGDVLLLTPRLKRLGKEALLPMLDAAVFHAPSMTGLSEAARRGWQLGLIEAIGMLRDPRALPVLEAILQAEANDFETNRLSAQAIARLGSDEALDTLLALAAGNKRDAVLAGLGECRRARAAQVIAAALDAAQTPAQAQALIRSLSAVGNAWAWQVERAHQEERALVQTTAARALVQAFVTFEDELRDNAATALLVVDAPETPILLAQAEILANTQTAAALQGIAKRFAQNPTRTSSERR